MTLRYDPLNNTVKAKVKAKIAFSLLTQSAEARHTPGRHPFGYEDVAVMVETGVVRVDELAVDPFPGIVAHAFHYLGDALYVFAKLDNDFVLFVEQGHARVELGDEQEVLVGVAVGRETVALESL